MNMNETRKQLWYRHTSFVGAGMVLLVTVLALVAVYAVRPTFAVDLGDYYDSVYLDGFHDREVDAANEGETWEWSPDEQHVTVPGKRNGVWIATLHVADTQPDGTLKGLAMSANEQRLNIPRQGARFMVGVIPPDVAAADDLVLRVEPGLREGPTPPAGLVGSVTLAPARTYRWSTDESHVRLPGIGRGAWRLDMKTVTAHPDGSPVNASIHVNDTPLVTLPDTPALRRISILLPASAMQSGDLNLTMQAETFADPRPLGLFVSNIGVAPVGTSAWTIETVLPPWRTLLYSLVIVACFYACLSLLAADIFDTYPSTTHINRKERKDQTEELRRYGLPLLATLALIATGTWALLAHRLPTTPMLPGLALLALWSVLLLVLLRPLLRRVLAPGANEDAPATNTPFATTRFAGIVLLIFFAGYWIKCTGMLYPYFIGIDVHWHMERVRWILNGDLPLLYGTNSPLNESTMPLAEWGENKPVIPYSPYYHMFAASFVIFPWSLEMSASMVSALFDSLHVLLIAWLAYRGGLSRRAAILATLLYTLLPVKFLLHSWGNVPTTAGLWWAFATTAWIVVGWNRLRRPAAFIVLTGLLLAALLFYTVAGVFTGLFLVCFTLLIILLARARPAAASAASALLAGIRPLWIAIVLAGALVLLVYYGQYIGPIIERTIPYFSQSLTSSAEEMGKAGDTLSGYITRHVRMWDYGLALPLILTFYWIVQEGRKLWRGEKQSETLSPTAPTIPPTTLLWAAISGWMLVTGIFIVAAFKVSMVDKHFFVSIPLMVIATAAVLDLWWERSRAVPPAILLWYVYLGISAINLWIMRIVTVKQ